VRSCTRKEDGKKVKDGYEERKGGKKEENGFDPRSQGVLSGERKL
jgi:hypothetical protein